MRLFYVLFLLMALPLFVKAQKRFDFTNLQKAPYQGTGSGLSLAYDIITKGHGGELKVDTQEGEFTEFVISLKRADHL